MKTATKQEGKFGVVMLLNHKFLFDSLSQKLIKINPYILLSQNWELWFTLLYPSNPFLFCGFFSNLYFSVFKILHLVLLIHHWICFVDNWIAFYIKFNQCLNQYPHETINL